MYRLKRKDWFPVLESFCRWRYPVTWYPYMVEVCSIHGLWRSTGQRFCFVAGVSSQSPRKWICLLFKILFIGSQYPKNMSLNFENKISGTGDLASVASNINLWTRDLFSRVNAMFLDYFDPLLFIISKINNSRGDLIDVSSTKSTRSECYWSFFQI